MTPACRAGIASRAASLGTWILCLLAWAALATACTSRETAALRHSLGDLSSADRLEVSVAGVTPVASITDPSKVKAVVAFVERYRDGWRNVWSGAGSERIVTFYAGTKPLKSLGVSPRHINDGDYARPLSEAEIAELIALLGIPWPGR
jgi:hypothetical protein